MKQFLLNKAQEYMAVAFTYDVFEDYDAVEENLDKADFIVSLVEEWEKQEQLNKNDNDEDLY